jgi:hypothetical protein
MVPRAYIEFIDRFIDVQLALVPSETDDRRASLYLS